MTEDLLLARAASVTVFTHFRGGSGGIGVDLAGGEAFSACARAGAAPTTAVVGATTAATLSFNVGVELVGGEALAACARAAVAWTRAELRATTAVASPPTLTVARGRAQEWLHLLSAWASLRFLSRARLLSLAGHRPGWREGGGVFWRKKVSFSIRPRASYSTRAQTPLSTHS
jgi:hypothetical protein